MNTKDLVSLARAALLVEHDAVDVSKAAAVGSVIPERSPIDAIVVPTARPANNLEEAIRLAAATGAFLVLVCSHDAQPSEVAAAMSRGGHESWMVIDLHDGWSHPLLSMTTDHISEALWGWAENDVSIKRNIGLLLAQLVGWGRLLFLDDDISDLDAARLHRAGALLDRYPAVGFRVSDFPDNSVVRHARRLTGATQDAALVSAGALAISYPGAGAFFPRIYNEDMFFLLPSLAHGPAAAVGTVSQQEYDPFAPQRAAREEFGDLLAEGMLDRLLTRGSLDPPTEADWANEIIARDRSLLDIITCLEHAATPRATRAKAAVQAARTRLQTISPAACARYISAWQADLRAWRRRVASLPTSLSPSQAALLLGLPATEK